jgi:hypothetical protein
MEKINWPFGEADKQELDYALTIAATITNMFTILVLESLGGVATLNLTVDSQVREGAMVALVVPADDDAYDLTLGTGIDGPVIVGVAGKTNTQGFIYDGTAFRPMGAYCQID